MPTFLEIFARAANHVQALPAYAAALAAGGITTWNFSPDAPMEEWGFNANVLGGGSRVQRPSFYRHSQPNGCVIILCGPPLEFTDFYWTGDTVYIRPTYTRVEYPTDLSDPIAAIRLERDITRAIIQALENRPREVQVREAKLREEQAAPATITSPAVRRTLNRLERRGTRYLQRLTGTSWECVSTIKGLTWLHASGWEISIAVEGTRGMSIETRARASYQDKPLAADHVLTYGQGHRAWEVLEAAVHDVARHQAAQRLRPPSTRRPKRRK